MIGSCIGTTNINQVNNGRRIFFFQFNGAHQRIPFIIWIDDPLYTILNEFRIVIRESYFCRGVRRFTDTD